MMRAGRLRHRVVIEQRTEGTADAFGAPALTWTTFATRWADVRPLQGRELFAAQQVQANVSHAVRLRHLAGVLPDMRLRHKLHTADNASGTATGGGSNYILLEVDGTQVDDEFNDWSVLLTGGTGAGQHRKITDYDHAGHGSGNRYAAVTPNWGTNPDNTSKYVIARWLNIASVINPGERDIELELLCTEDV